MDQKIFYFHYTAGTNTKQTQMSAYMGKHC